MQIAKQCSHIAAKGGIKRERANERERKGERQRENESFVVAIRTDVKNSTSNDGKMFLSRKHERKEVLTN